MNEALVVSNIVLWIAVLVLAGVVLALLRQVGVLHERIAPAGALMSGGGPEVGAAAPVLHLQDWNGEARTIGGADAEGKSTLLLFVSPTCPVCKTVLAIAMSMQNAERRWLRLVLGSDGPREEHEAFVREQVGAGVPYLLSSALGLTYRVGKLPYAVLVDREGIVRGRGLVNTREHLDSLVEAKNLGVASLQDYMKRAEGGSR